VVRIPPLPPAEAGTRFSDPGGMQGWVDLCYMKATSRELNPRPVNRQVQGPTAEPPSVWQVVFTQSTVFAPPCRHVIEQRWEDGAVPEMLHVLRLVDADCNPNLQRLCPDIVYWSAGRTTPQSSASLPSASGLPASSTSAASIHRRILLSEKSSSSLQWCEFLDRVIRVA